MKKIIGLLNIIIISLLIVGCSNNEEIYKIETSSTEISNNSEKKSIKEILHNNPSTIEVSEKYVGLNMKDLILENYSEKEKDELSEIIDENKKTIIFITSPYCSSCDNIDYTSILALESDYNVILATLKDYEDSSKFNEKGIYNSIYLIDNDKLVSAYNDNNEQLQNNYLKIISSMGLPSCLFINSDGTFAFGTNGIKTAKELEEYINFLN